MPDVASICEPNREAKFAAGTIALLLLIQQVLLGLELQWRSCGQLLQRFRLTAAKRPLRFAATLFRPGQREHHTNPLSCVGHHEVSGEALAGESIGSCRKAG
jgi:hypothetical protein